MEELPKRVAVAYTRVSTNGQAEDGFGLAIQREAIREWLRAHDIDGFRHFSDEGVSGKILERPGLTEALSVLGDGSLLIVARLDRLARDLITQELLLLEIKRVGARLVSCADGEQAYLDDDPDDPSRKMIRQVLGAVSEYERAMVVLRLRVGRRAKRAKGGYAGGVVPFGWRWERGRGVLIDEREMLVLQTMIDYRQTGSTLGQIADMLNRGGPIYRPRHGPAWNVRRISRIMQNSPLVNPS